MKPRTIRLLSPIALLVAIGPVVAQRNGGPPRNVVLFVADGLRPGSVNEHDTPALWAIRTQGVDFENSHSVFPTVTTANASVIATGHGLGDTGDYGNTIWPGFATFDTGNFNQFAATAVPFIENDRILADLDAHFGGNYLGSETFLAIARHHGYRTAAIGKLGPAAIQDMAALAPAYKGFPPTVPGIIIDDATGGAGLPMQPALARQMAAAGVPTAAPSRSNGFGPLSPFNNGFSGDYTTSGTLTANTVQQDWFIDVTTQFVLPELGSDRGTPFAMVYWSRDPDGTQHNQGDSLGSFVPGVNGDTSRRAVRNADRALGRLLAWFDANPDIKANTDVFVTSDHGFATISRSAVDRTGRRTRSESARHSYLTDNRPDTAKGTLPNGCLAIDLAYDLQLNLFDPDQHVAGSPLLRQVRMGSAATDAWEHPVRGNALIGGTANAVDGRDARLIVAANGGSDLIYVPDGNNETVARVVARLLTYDYVSGIFVDDKYGAIRGTLPLSAINLIGSSALPRPAIVVAFKVFYRNPGDLQSAVQVSDTDLQEGQGNHGGFGRDSTYNTMAAVGPDFKQGYVDRLPVGNGDIAPTLAHLLGFDLPKGPLVGRVLVEALASGVRAAVPPPIGRLRSAESAGRQLILMYQQHDGVRYLDAACFVTGSARDTDACR